MSTPDSRRLLFVTLSNIGDLIMTTPALRALHDAYPDHLIDIVADLRSSPLLAACPYLGRLYHRHKEAGTADILRLVRGLRRIYYTAIVDLRTDFLPWLLRGERRIVRWQRKTPEGHATARHLAVAAAVLPTPVELPYAEVWTSDADDEFAANALSAQHGDRILAIAPGANWPGKIWPVAHYAELIAHASREFSTLLILGGAADLAAADFLAATSKLPVLNLTGRTSLTQAAALLDHARAFVGNDSGLGHLAAARRVPTLTLFGPGDPARYRPWGPITSLVRAPNDDLSRLSASTVAAELRDLIARARPRDG